MKRISRFLGVFLCLAVLLSVSIFAGSNTIDVSTADEGYFTVEYDAPSNLKMKVGINFNGKTTYYNYTPGTEAAYTFNHGEGFYTISLYRNVSGTSYRLVTSEKVIVEAVDEMAKYLVSTAEVTFAEDDAVGMKAAELCEGLETDEEKVVAIHNYIAEYFSYDYDFAAGVRNGSIKNYTPDTAHLLEKQQGVCYDFSALFAAMCRSQEIPCAVAKGYTTGGYHAWNMVWLNEQWVAVDLTVSIAYGMSDTDEVSDFTASMNRYFNYTF
ncbi:MAG: transglutaminase domain-containing protein [Clostridia bacterium]|nr:transglutaminase domain-containing protein [Clostridia bacterium]